MAKILVVDDDPSYRELVRQVLDGRGHELAFAADPVAASYALAHQTPDLLMLDVQMPAGGGRQVYRTVRGNPELAKLPILVVTGAGDAQRVCRLLEVPEDPRIFMLPKPVHIQALVKAVETLLK